ncbi:MAG TPA: hypothetical protein PL033_08775 [Candidatus Brocadiia bacterium]|nr:hypothetical protein [Candidatus Brocadiia bacterium]
MTPALGSVGEDGFLWFEGYEEFALWCEAEAQAMRTESGAREDEPADGFAMAEKLGFQVWEVSSVPGGSGYRGGRRAGKKIFLHADARAERKHFTILREMAERRITARVNEEHLHIASSAIAGCLLMPGKTFCWDGGVTNWDLVALKKRYPKASFEAIARRIPPFKACVVTIADQGQVRRGGRFGSITHPAALAPLEEEAMKRLLEHKAGEGEDIELFEYQNADETIAVRAWGVFSESVKRVIILTEAKEE